MNLRRAGAKQGSAERVDGSARRDDIVDDCDGHAVQSPPGREYSLHVGAAIRGGERRLGSRINLAGDGGAQQGYPRGGRDRTGDLQRLIESALTESGSVQRDGDQGVDALNRLMAPQVVPEGQSERPAHAPLA